MAYTIEQALDEAYKIIIENDHSIFTSDNLECSLTPEITEIIDIFEVLGSLEKDNIISVGSEGTIFLTAEGKAFYRDGGYIGRKKRELKKEKRESLCNK